jgi:hypothetical protein
VFVSTEETSFDRAENKADPPKTNSRHIATQQTPNMIATVKIMGRVVDLFRIVSRFVKSNQYL